MAPKITTSDRNKALIADYDDGCTIQHLSKHYSVTVQRAQSIITDEINRRRASPDEFYRHFRAAEGAELPPLVSFDFRIPQKPPTPKSFL
jgi:hypothetical protein